MFAHKILTCMMTMVGMMAKEKYREKNNIWTNVKKKKHQDQYEED